MCILGAPLKHQDLSKVNIVSAYFRTSGPEAVYQQVRKRFPRIFLRTVYKKLEKCCQVGLIQDVSPITEVARYDVMTGPRHYMVCRECQSIRNPDSIVEEPKVSVCGQNGFHVMRRQEVLNWHCPACKGNIADSRCSTLLSRIRISASISIPSRSDNYHRIEGMPMNHTISQINVRQPAHRPL